MTKRKWLRYGVYLVDSYEETPGKTATVYIPVEWTGEKVTLDAQVQNEALEQIVAGVPGFGLYELGSELPEDLVETLLSAVESGSARAALPILRFVNDTRVRPALIKAVSTLRPGPVDDFVQALGLAGGDGACLTLRERLRSTMQQAEPYASEPCGLPFASTLRLLASALLALDPEDLFAAQVLVRLMGHAVIDERRAAAREAAHVYRPLCTEAMRTLSLALEQLLDEPSDPEMFLHASKALAHRHFGTVLRRCERILDGSDPSIRNAAVSALLDLPGPNSAQAIAVLVRWVPQGSPFSVALRAAGFMKPLLDPVVLADICRRGLSLDSPLLRYETLHLILGLPGELQRALIAEAILDEPDPLIERRMHEISGSLE